LGKRKSTLKYRKYLTKSNIHTLELLSPAKNLESGITAINYGADAVYIGPEKFGARAAAGNSISDIAQLTEFAHQFNVKVYVTINTIFDDAEINKVQKLIEDLDEAGVDALIIQDLGILKLNTLGLPLFASTQTHNYEIDRIKFLEQLGFQRFILARELSLEKINEIRKAVRAELEVFVFGALCVSYSGQCYASFATTERSANRGECSQICRHKFNLLNEKGDSVCNPGHLLSLKDLNLKDYLGELIDIGVSSFKIEGRLKDINYVKNATGYFSQSLNQNISQKSNFLRSSGGTANMGFVPDLNKTFNRGFSDYFIEKRKSELASFQSPKNIGELIGKVTELQKNSLIINSKIKLKNGDGITFFNENGELDGFLVNRAESNLIYPNKMPKITIGTILYRNKDIEFELQVANDKSKRKIAATIEINLNEKEIQFEISDRDNNYFESILLNNYEWAENEALAKMNIEKQMRKSGNSIFEIDKLIINREKVPFIPLSELNNIRNLLLQGLLENRMKNYFRAKVPMVTDVPHYFENSIDYHGNVMNQLSRKLYKEAGVSSIEDAFEKSSVFDGKIVMTTKYCVKYEIGICPVHQKSTMNSKEWENRNRQLYLEDNNHKYRLDFDCKRCEMQVIY
jgi:putative protease